MKFYKELTERQQSLFNRIDGLFVADLKAKIIDMRAVLELLTYKYNRIKRRTK